MNTWVPEGTSLDFYLINLMDHLEIRTRSHKFNGPLDLRVRISLRTNIPNDRSLGPQKILGLAEVTPKKIKTEDDDSVNSQIISAENISRKEQPKAFDIIINAIEATEYFVNEVLVKSWTILEKVTDSYHELPKLLIFAQLLFDNGLVLPTKITKESYNKFKRDVNKKLSEWESKIENTKRFNTYKIDSPKYSSSPNYLGNSAKNIKSPSIVESMVIDANFKETIEILEQETMTETIKDFIDLKNKFIRHHDKFEFATINNINEDLKIKYESTKEGIGKLQNEVLQGNVDTNHSWLVELEKITLYNDIITDMKNAFEMFKNNLLDLDKVDDMLIGFVKNKIEENYDQIVAKFEQMHD
ncbi:16153_t:CDS:2, partial [Gigaspora margarita]